MRTSKLFLIRHAPVKKIKGYVPQNDPIAIINKKNIKKLALHIPHGCTWYVSPLKRATQTAKALSKFASPKKIIIEKKLVEQNFGDWSGKKISEVWKEIKKNKKRHNFSFICPEISPPNGDSFLDQCKRASLFIENLKLQDKNPIVIIAHAGTIRAILSYVLEIKPDVSIGIEIKNLSLSVLEIIKKENFKNNQGGRFRLLGLNKSVS